MIGWLWRDGKDGEGAEGPRGEGPESGVRGPGAGVRGPESIGQVGEAGVLGWIL